MSKARTALEHHLWAEIKKLGLEKPRFLVCCSGGGDSLALLAGLHQVCEPGQIQVLHFHHGEGENKSHRDQAEACVRQFCQQRGIPFLLEKKPAAVRATEADWRKWRRERAEFWAQKQGGLVLVTAHHAQDLLETRIMRLIRGTGHQGLQAMKAWNPPWWRPCLELSPQDLRSDLQMKGLEPVEDPSNFELGPLRNWLRHEWLPRLEARRRGSLKSMALSLHNLWQATQKGTAILRPGVIEMALWLSSSREEKLSLLARHLSALGKLDFSRGQLEEICKRLDSRQKSHRFQLASCEWVVEPQQISLHFPVKEGAG